MSYIAVKQETLNKITSYLGKRPYIEVFHLFKDLQNNVKPIDEALNEFSRKKEISEKD